MSRLWLSDDSPVERVTLPLWLVAGAVLSVAVRVLYAARRRWQR